MNTQPQTQDETPDAEIAAPVMTVSAAAAAVAASAETINALQAIIERSIDKLDALKKEKREFAESMKNILDNDQELSKKKEEIEETSKGIKERKTSLTGTAEYKTWKAKLDAVNDEVKEIEESLNTHLLNYFQQTGVKSIDLSSGKQREFRILAKVMPKKLGEE